MAKRLKEKEAQFCKDNSVKQCKALPPDAAAWDDFECDLWFRTKGLFHPRRELSKFQRRAGAALQDGDIRDLISASTDYRVHDDPKGRPGRVSVVCPTIESRQQFHPTLWQAFDSQTWPDKELIVIETYQRYPSKFFFEKAKEDTRIIHVHFRRPLPMKLRNMKLVKDGADEGGEQEEQPLLLVPSCTRGDFSIGLKRNLGTYLSSGEFIANFDDDDLYAPSYLRSMVHSLQAADSMAVKLSSWFVFNLLTGSVFECDPVKQNSSKDKRYGYGFSYVYRRSAALTTPYPDVDRGEDYAFYSTLLIKHGDAAISMQRDTFGRCLHIQHGGNLTEIYPHRELKDSEACGSYEFTACAGFDHYMCWVSTNEALMSMLQSAPTQTQEEFLFAMKGKALPSKELAAQLNVSHQELREIILGFKQGFDGKTEQQIGNDAGRGSVDDGLGEWSSLAESQHPKAGDRVKVRWPIYTDDESGRTLLTSGLRGLVVKAHGNGDVTMLPEKPASGEEITGKRIKKKQFHRLMLWCPTYLAGKSGYDALEYDVADVVLSLEDDKEEQKRFSSSVRDIVCR